MSLMKHDCHTHWRSIIPSYSRSLRPCHTHWWSFYHVHILPKDWWNIIPWCFTSLQSCYTHWWKHHPIMLHILTVMLHTLMEASSHHASQLYSHVKHWWKHHPIMFAVFTAMSHALMKHHPIMLFFLPKDWWSIIPSCYSSYQRIEEAPSHHVILPTKGLMKHHPIMLFFLPKDWWSTIPLCYSSYQRIDEASSHYVILPTKGLMKHHPIMLHSLTAISCTLMKQIRSCFTSLQPCHTHWWKHPPLMLTHIPYSHFIPYGGASYHHVHTLTATSHPTVEPPTIMLTHLQPHHTQLWSLLPSCSHTYSHVTPNCGASYHHVHTLTAMSHPTIEHFYPSHTYSFHTLICTLIPTLTFMSHSMMETAFPGLVSSTNSS